MKRWEYIYLEYCYDYNGLQVRNIWRAFGDQPEWLDLNEMGKEGWEMCGIVPENHWNSQSAIFKRPVEETPPAPRRDSGAE